MRSTALLVSLLAISFAVPTALSGGLSADAPVDAADAAAEARVVLGFHGTIPADAEAWVAARGGTVELRDDVLAFLAVRAADAAAAESLLAAAQGRDDVRYAEQDGLATTLATPNDPLYSQQWGYPAIFAPQAWDVQKGSHAVKVAILDTGIATTHPDLAANVCGPHASFVPFEPTITDYNSHGTHVSGTVAAVNDNGVGVAGTGQSCLMGAKVLSGGGWGYWTWVAAGIRWAADNGAHVISMSLGGGDPGAVVRDAVRYAWDKNVLIVAAAGNSGCSNPNGDGTVIWPARYPEAMAVAALSSSTGVAGFSSCGKKVEIAAPGQGVLSTTPWGYASYSGTSMATPHVSGVAGLLKAHNPAWGAAELRCALQITADDINAAGRDGRTGFGRLNAAKLIAPGLGSVGSGASLAQSLPGCLATLTGLPVPALPAL